MAGTFITFDGMEGAGKSTQISRLMQSLEASGHEVIVTREPGGTQNAETLRSLLVAGEVGSWSPIAECLIMNAARADHLENTIRPALADGKTVLCDRFLDSTRAYQGGAGGVRMEDILAIERAVVGETMPHVSFIFDLSPEEGLERARQRGGDDRFERKGIEYHIAVRKAFQDIVRSEPERCVLIDAARSVETVAETIYQALHSRGIVG